MRNDIDQLVAAAMDGDDEALAALLRRIGPDVQSRLSLSRRWQSLLDLDDVMQVSYLEAYLRIGRLEQPTARAFEAWLRSIAENNLRDGVRELSRRKRPESGRRVGIRGRQESMADLFTAVLVTTTTPSRSVSREEERRFLEESLERLPRSYREVIDLYEIQGHPAEEVGRAIGKSAGAVYMIRARALVLLGEMLDGWVSTSQGSA